MNATQKIILHKALTTDLKLRHSDAARIALALDLLGHGDLAVDVANIADHVTWADGNLAKAEAAAPREAGFMGFEMPAGTPEVIEAEAHVERYRADWWEVKIKIDAIAAELEQSIDLAAYAAYEEAQVIA